MTLKRSIGGLHLTQTQLQTIITVGIVNSRPLVSVDDLENQMVTPMHFLSLNAKNGTPALTSQDEEDDSNDPDYQNQEMAAQEVSETWGKSNKHLKKFWK